MQAFWLKFADGHSACCEGNSEYDVKAIAKKLVGSEPVECDRLPYPANPIIWQLDHPVYGVTPKFCHDPKNCKGKTCCPKNYSCTE